MAGKRLTDENKLKNVFERLYSPKILLAAVPRLKNESSVRTAAEFKTELETLSKALEENPSDSMVLAKLKKVFAAYKAFCVRQKKRIKGRKNKYAVLLRILNSISQDMLIKQIAAAELYQYERYFAENAHAVKYKVSTVLKNNAGKRLRDETLLDIYKILSRADSIKLKIEQGLLENPKELYPAARAMHRRFIIHAGTTNTGKTYNAVKALKAAEAGVYLGPLRLLALEIQEELLMSNVMCSLKTGEEENIVRYATHMASTVEMVNLYALYNVAVIDECQMIGDKYRGCAWTRAILGLRAEEIHLCTAPDAVDILVKIIEDCGDEYEIVNYQRRTPLVYDSSIEVNAQISWQNEAGDLKKPGCAERLKKINIDKLQYGDALIAFSRKDVLETAELLRDYGIEASVIYGALPYSARKQQLKRFIKHETSVIVATDAIGMGLNLPIRRIIFTTPYKFDGGKYRILNPSEIKQIAGRAGRIGIYDEGLVSSVHMSEYIKEAIEIEPEPIERAYIDFDTAFVEIEYGLKDILEAWHKAELPFEIYKKINIDRTMLLLRKIDSLCSEKNLTCDKETAYRLANIVFDEKEPSLQGQWIEYTEAYLTLVPELPLPVIRTKTLDELEISFKKADLYYYFCHAMGYAPDVDWIDKVKAYISEEINRTLRR